MNFMKINKLHVMLTTAAIGIIGVLVTTSIPASYLSVLAATVSYLAVGVLVALAALDYRVGPKGHSLR